MVRTRAQVNNHHKMRPDVADKPETNVSLGEVISSGARKTSGSNSSTCLFLEEVNSSRGKKGANQLLRSNIQSASKSRTFRALHSHFLRSSLEEDRLPHEGHSAISSAKRLSYNFQPTWIDRTQILDDISSGFKNSSLKLDISQVQLLCSLQASASKLDVSPTILDRSKKYNLRNIKMPKGFHKYLEETVIASGAKMSSEQDTLEEGSSTLEKEPDSSTPSKLGGQKRHKEMCENQQLFQEVLGEETKQQTSADSLPSQKNDFSQNTTMSTPLAQRPFGRKCSRTIAETEYENVLTHLSTTFSPRKYSTRIGDDLSRQSISLTPQAVQPFGEKRKRIKNEDTFEDVLNQPSLRSSPRKSASRIGDASQKSIPKSPQAVQPFDKRQKGLQINNHYEGMLSQSSPGLSPRKSNSKIGEISQSSISKSQPSGKRQKRLKNDNFEGILSHSSPKLPARKSNSKIGETSQSSISKSQPSGKRKKRLKNDNFEGILSHSSPRLSPRKSNSKIGETSQSNISKSQSFGKRQKRLQNDNFESILDQSSPALTPRKPNCKTCEVLESSISKSPQALEPFPKRQKKLQSDHFESILLQSSTKLSVRISKFKSGEVSQSNISKSPQTLQPFGKKQKRLLNKYKFEEILNQSSPTLSTRKHGIQTVQSFDKRQKRERIENTLEDTVGLSPDTSTFRAEEVSQQSISKTPQAVQPFGLRQKRKQNEVHFEDILSESSSILSPTKSNSKVEQVLQNNITESLSSAQIFNKSQNRMQRKDNLEGTISQSIPRRSSRKLGSQTGSISQSKHKLEDTVSQSLVRSSPRKNNSKADQVSQSHIPKSPEAVQPFGKRQKRIQNEDNLEGTLSQSSTRTSPRKFSSKTRDTSQKEDKLQGTVNQSSPRTFQRELNSKAGKVSLNHIPKSPQIVPPFGKCQKRIDSEDKQSQSPPRTPPKNISSETGEVSQNEDKLEVMVNQSLLRRSLRKPNSKAGKVSQRRISKSPEAVQPFGFKQKRKQNEVNFEDILSQSSFILSPSKSNSKTGDVSQSSISKLPQVVQPFDERQKRIQNEDGFQNILNRSSPRKPSSKTGGLSLNSICESPLTAQTFSQTQKRIQNEYRFKGGLRHSSPILSPRKHSLGTKEVLQDNILESPAVIDLYIKTEKRIQNEDTFEDTISQLTPRLSQRKSATWISFSESLAAMEPFDEHNENNFKDVLSQPLSRLSQRKSSRELSKSSEVVKPLTSKERTQENAVLENMLDASLHKQIASKSAPECTEETNVSLVAVSVEDNLRSFIETNKESLENENQESYDQSYRIGFSSKSTRHITVQKGNVSQNNIFKSPKSSQIFGQRKHSNEGNFSYDLEHSSPKEISKSDDKSSMKRNDVSAINEDSSQRLNQSTSLKCIAAQRMSTESLLAGDPELQKDISSHGKQRKGNLKHDIGPVHENMYVSDPLECEISLKINERENNSSKNHVNTDMSSSFTFAFHKASESYVSQKNTSNNNVPSMLTQILDGSLKEGTDSAKYLASLRDTACITKISEEHYKDNLIHTNEKCENASPLQDGVGITLHRGLQRTSQGISSSQSHKNSKFVLHTPSELQSSHLQMPGEGSTARHSSDSESNILEVQTFQQSAKIHKNDIPQKKSNTNTREREKKLDVSCELQTLANSRVGLEHKRDVNFFHENNRSEISGQSKKDHSLTGKMQREDSKNLSEELPTKRRQKLTDLNELEESFQAASVTSQESTVESITSEEQRDKLYANEELAFRIREKAMRNQSKLFSSEKVKNCTLTKNDNSELESRVQKREMVRKGSLEQSKNPEPLTASHVFQNTSSGPFDSARMDSSASSLKSTTDESLYLRLKTKRKRYRKLSRLKNFDAATSGSSNVSKHVGDERPTFVRKQKESNKLKKSYNGLVPTKHIANTESRAVVHNMASVVTSVILSDAENEVQNVTGLIAPENAKVEDEYRKEKEYYQSSTEEINYIRLDSNTCKSGGRVKIGPRLFKSWLERRACQHKKQRKIQNNDKQLKMPFYHQQGTRDNEPHNMHLVLKSIAEGNVHKDKRLEDKYIMNLTTVNVEAQEEVLVKKINPALMVNGKMYRAPRMFRPKKWVNKHLYDYIMPSITAKYGEVNSRTKAEEYLNYLCHQVSTVVRRKNYNNYRSNLEKIKKSLYNLGLIKCYNDYFIFIEKYLPFEFRYKAIPCVRAFGKHTGPPWSKDINIFDDLGY